MPNHTHDDSKPKPKPKPQGPKERELAVSLTAAVLGATKIDEPLAVVAQMTLELYAEMLAALTKRGPDPEGVERYDRAD